MSEKLGKVIRYIRKSKKMTAYELSLESNFSNSYICDLEKGRKKGTDETFRIIFDVFGINYYDFLEENKKILDLINETVTSITHYQLHKKEEQLQKLITLRREVICSLHEDDIDLLLKLSEMVKGTKFLPGDIAIYDKKLHSLSSHKLKELYLLYKGIKFIKIFNYDQAENYFLNLTNSVSISDSIKGIAFAQLSTISANNGQFVKALRYNDFSQGFLMEDMNINRLFIDMLNISDLYLRVGDHTHARRTLYEIISKRDRYFEESIYFNAVANLAFTYYLEYDFDKSIQIIEKYGNPDEFTQNMYFLLIWGLSRQKDERINLVIPACQKKFKGCMDKRLELLIALVCTECNTSLERELLKYYNSLKNCEDFFTKIVGLRMIIFFYEENRKYKVALQYCRNIQKFYFNSSKVTIDHPAVGSN